VDPPPAAADLTRMTSGGGLPAWAPRYGLLDS
jgi:hypothetical protein